MSRVSGSRPKTTHKATETKAKGKTETSKPASKPKSTGWSPASSGGGESGRSSSYTPPPPSYSSGGGE
jgi:hypothetical protein